MTDRFERDEQRRRAKARIGSEKVHTDLYHMYKAENKWTLFGKHYGTPIDKLPQSYLIWIIENIQGKHKELAEKEVFRRKSI